jgi:hypothetical protein
VTFARLVFRNTFIVQLVQQQNPQININNKMLISDPTLLEHHLSLKTTRVIKTLELLLVERVKSLAQLLLLQPQVTTMLVL